MDEEIGLRMTRLRRRLSVEQNEDVSSPATPSKKRVGKLAKPALDNIAENAVVSSPKRATRRSIAAENVNADEVVSSPAKKTTRTRANSSLLSDSMQAVESPRAVRITRRNSLAGSEIDPPAVLTPVRRSRRISKDAKSPDTPAEVKIQAKRIKRNSMASQDVIAEEAEKDNKNESNSSPTKASPAQKKISTSVKSSNDLIGIAEELSSSEKSSPRNIRKSPRLSSNKNSDDANFEETNSNITLNVQDENNVNDNKYNGHNSLNKSKEHNINGSPTVESKQNKKRSKSFTSLETELKNDSQIYYSDNESRKITSKKINPNVDVVIETTEIGDHKNKSKLDVSKNSTATISDENKENKIGSRSSLCLENVEKNQKSSDSSGIDVLNKSNKPLHCVDTKISSTIIMDDSDGGDDRPCSIAYKNTSLRTKLDDSCEPMDVDVTIPEINTSNNNISNSESFECLNQQKQISLLNQLDSGKERNDNGTKVNEKNKRISKTNESKSTFLLSVNSDREDSLKNNKTLESNSHSKSFDVNMNKEHIKKINLSLAESKSTGNTPIRHNLTQKMAVFTSTPVQCTKPENKNLSGKQFKGKRNTPIEENTIYSEDHDSRTSDEDEIILKKNSLLNDEAESAGDDYESGDSQNESENEYIEQNEIPTKGETLESEEDIGSDNSEYEKDSFVVSSNDEDDELLSGSGDDLSMTDNELKMTAKSKEKYNKRKLKEQKRASQEMFESRHGKSKECSFADDSDEADITFANKNKKKNRLRLDSSKDTSEKEISVLQNVSDDKDPLMNSILIKQEKSSFIDNSTGEAIENIEIDQNVTIFTSKETKNPLQSFNENSENDDSSSDDGGIADNYDNLLKDLNEPKLSKTKVKEVYDQTSDSAVSNQKKLSSSFSECKKKLKHNNNSLLDKLNITQSRKEKKSYEEKKSPHAKNLLSLNSHSNAWLENETTLKDIEKNTFMEGDKVSSDYSNNSENKNSDAPSSNTNKCKKMNQSLNETNQKVKKDSSLIDKLNLTNGGKESKSNKKQVRSNETINIAKPTKVENDESSSDGIDFKLLFPQDEESNDTPCHDESENNNFIPLKKSRAKTNLLENSGPTEPTESSVLLKESPAKSAIEIYSKKNDKPAAKHKDIVQNNEQTIKKGDSKESGNNKKNKQNRAHNEDTTKDIQTHQPEQPSRKRKAKDSVPVNNNKVYLANSENKIQVHRLPQSILDKLEDVPKQIHKEKSKTVTATSHFEVQPIIQRKNKPSHYLEESIHIDRSPVQNRKDSKQLKKPKVLPSIPKATTSIVGFTSNFKVNILKQDKRLDAKMPGSEEMFNFKTQRLYGSSIKRIATEELCRKQKKIKTTKF